MNLSYNSIGNVDPYIFVNLTKLVRLDLSFNNIIDLQDTSIWSLPNLQFLQLAHNNLSVIEEATFAKQKTISSLDLSYNLIRKINFNNATRMEHLEKFHINDNQLNDLDGFKNFLFPSLNSFAITGNKFNCSYLRTFLKSFEYHSSLSVLHLNNSPVNNGQDEVHGVNCYNVRNPPNLPESTTISDEMFSSTEKDTQFAEFTTFDSVNNAITTTQDKHNLQDTTTATTLVCVQGTPTVADPTTSHIIKELLIVVCVLVALNVCVMIIKIIRNRKATSVTSATNYSCAYNTDNGQRFPILSENQYETVLITSK